jgi:uncharacterized protein YceK
MLTVKVFILTLLVGIGLAGCTSVESFLDRNNTAAMIVVQQATARTIEVGKTAADQQARAIKVIQIATDVQQTWDTTAKDLPAILDLVALRVAELKLGPADALLAQDLIQAAGQLISEKLCPGGTAPNPTAPTACTIAAGSTTYVDTVLGWVIGAAKIYTLPS